MRLIDADKLKSHYAWWNNEEKGLFDSVVDAQPTAYDVEKVVAELEESKTNFEHMGPLQSAYYDKGLDKAIEIVRKGGVDNAE